ncbi:MAG TPA: MarR family transcriptional regulator [Holophagaceae bacterium]|nr:MarR family transcriptional regulator [Holophagaceae bacterium]
MNHLRRIVRALEVYSKEVEARFGLTGPQLWGLWELGQGGPMALKDLAARMQLHPSTVVGVVDRLADKDLVVRRVDPEDRRRVSLTLTTQGKATLRKAPHPAQGRLVHGLKGLSPRQRAAIHKALATLVKLMEAEDLEARFFFAKR